MRYWIDQGDCLAQVDGAWDAFALENGAPELTCGRALGRPMGSFCGDLGTLGVWAALLARARQGTILSVRIRCDAPDRRRLLDLRVSVEQEGMVVVESRVMSEEARARVALLGEPTPAPAS